MVSWHDVRGGGQINDDGLPGEDEYTDTSFAFSHDSI